MPKTQKCAKCGKSITSKPKILNGKVYHTSCRELILGSHYGR